MMHRSTWPPGARAIAALLLVAGLLPRPCSSLDNGLALTPIMGWNTWDHFRCSGGKTGGLGHPCNAAMDNCVSEVLIRQVADAIVARGLKGAGYEYINLDDCWMAKSRDQQGKLQPDATRFPGEPLGLRTLARAQTRNIRGLGRPHMLRVPGHGRTDPR